MLFFFPQVSGRALKDSVRIVTKFSDMEETFSPQNSLRFVNIHLFSNFNFASFYCKHLYYTPAQSLIQYQTNWGREEKVEKRKASQNENMRMCGHCFLTSQTLKLPGDRIVAVANLCN